MAAPNREGFREAAEDDDDKLRQKVFGMEAFLSDKLLVDRRSVVEREHKVGRRGGEKERKRN